MLDNNELQDKRLLILTGPQGSGNHMFSRVFSWHPDVQGWDALKRNYWVPSDQEPFAEYWVYPERLTSEHFNGNQYFFANVSAPFFYDGVRQLPKIHEVAQRARDFGVEVVIGIVTRDKTINQQQQDRVGGEVTWAEAMYYYRQNLLPNFECHFISNETLFAWNYDYLLYLGRLLKFPVDITRGMDMVDTNPNRKYIKVVDEHWLDDEIRAGRRPFADRVMDHLRGNFDSH